MKTLKSLDLGTIITICIILMLVSCFAYGIVSGQPATKDLNKQRSEKLKQTASIVTIGQHAYAVQNN